MDKLYSYIHLMLYYYSQIYPAAVKARQQHYLRAKKLEDLRKKILLQKRKQKSSFSSKLAKETTAWRSEYQNQYPTYDNEEYARRLRAIDSARARKVKCDLQILCKCCKEQGLSFDGKSYAASSLLMLIPQLVWKDVSLLNGVDMIDINQY